MNFDGGHFGQEDIVIAGGNAVDGGALDLGKDVVEERGARFAETPRKPVEAIVDVSGETFGKMLLVVAQNTEAEIAGAAEDFDGGDGVSQADENERRIEGNRGKGVDGKGMRSAFWIESGGDGNAGGEAATGPAEIETGDGDPKIRGMLA